MKKVTGIASVAGIAIAQVYKLQEPDLSYKQAKTNDKDAELRRLDDALAISIEELEKIKEYTVKAMGEEHAEIFSAHVLILRDPELINSMKEKITNDSVIAEVALEEVTDRSIQFFINMDNEYMRERAADIADVSKRVLAHLLEVEFPNPALINEQVIIISDDLTPSDTAQLNRKFVKGFATNVGGRTSHTAILARSLEIPAIVGTKEITKLVQAGETVIIDGLEGFIIINPDEATLADYYEKQSDYEKQKEDWTKLKDELTFTADGYQLKLAGNINTPEDVQGILNNGAEAVGLYRTEFLYMGKLSLPSEDVQYEAYKSVLQQMGNKPVVVRTLDIGGDKELSYLDLPKEINPFLGFRAIRFCLENEDVFRPQLRALLRASVHGNLKVMFPMIATLEEFRAAKSLLLEEKAALTKDGVEISESIEVGIMVEIPSTALLASQFAKEVDFFSIGTNDLIQYTMAADRLNPQVSYLYQPYHPAILNLIDNVIQAAHKEGKRVSMCSEMASDPIAIQILVGLGLDEFSMSATSILPVRAQIKKLSKKIIASFREALLTMGTAEEVFQFVKEKIQ